jgi:cytoskeletal protein RodZ
MKTFGDRLRIEREHRGLTIRAVAEILGVDQGRLLALEQNDFEARPDEATMMQCLHAYADCLRVDAELMIEDYVREREECLRQLADALPDRSAEAPAAMARSVRVPPSAIPAVVIRFSVDRWTRYKLVVAAAGIIVAVAILGAWWMRSGDGIPSSPTPGESGAAPRASSEKSPLADTAATAVPKKSVAAAPVRPASSESPLKPPAFMTSETSGLRISDYGVGTSVANRKLVGRSERFTEGTEAWFWTRVEGGKGGEAIEHVWLRNGVEVLRMPLRIGGAGWRTYSAKTLRAPGDWAVEARDDSGRVLARGEFVCVP